MSTAPAAPIPLDQIDITQLSVPEQSTGAVPLDAIDVSQLSVPGVPLEQVDTNALKTAEQWLTGLPRNRLVEEAAKAKSAGQDITPFRRAYVERAREGNIIDDDRSGEQTGPKPGLLRRGWNGISHLFEGGFKVVDNVSRALGPKGIISGIPSSPDVNERARLLDEVVTAAQVGTGSSLNDIRQGVISVANKVYRKNEDSPWDNEAFNEQFDADLKALEWIEAASRGEKLKGATGVDPEAVNQMAPAADASMLLPVGIGYKTARSAAPVAAAVLEKSVPPALGAEVLAGTARATASALRKTQRAVDENPLLHGLAAAGATTVVGGDAGQAMLAGLLGANVKSLGIAKATLGRGATTLEKTSDQLLGKVPPGPIGAFAAAAARAVKPELKGAALGQLANTPFLLGAQSEEEFKDLLATGLVGHAMGSSAGHVLNGLSISRNYFAPGDRAPEIRLPVKDLGIDATLDAGHQGVVSKLNNASNNFVQALRDFSRKENGEVYVLDQPSYEKYVDGLVGQPMIGANGREVIVTPEFANVVKRQQGVRLTLPGEKGPRQVAISRVTEALPGLSVGHEVGHLFEHTLSPEELAHIQKKTREYYGDEQLVEYHKRYEDLVDPDRDRSNDPQSWEDMSPTEQQNVLSEVFAEHASAVFNAIPVGKFGLNDGAKNYAREVYGMVGRGLEKLGVKQPELSPEGFDPKKTVTGTGIQPSMRLSTLIENAIQAKRLDGELPKTVPSAPGPKIDSEPANVRPVEPKAQPKGFKKGDPIGDFSNPGGVLQGENAKVVEDNGDGTVDLEYTHPDTGNRVRGTVPAAWLESKTTAAAGTTPTPAPKEVFPKSPVTPETPFGSAKADTLPVPRTTENTTRPEAAAPNLRATPEQQAAIAGPADANVVQKNVATLKAADAQPRNARPVVETDYYSAKSPISHPDQMVREQQRLAADAAEVDGQPNPLRTRYQKLFVPYKFRDNANGTQSVFGMSLDKVAQNLDLLKGFLRINPDVAFDRDYLTGSEIASDLQTFLKNQSNGYAGNGSKLTRPSDARDITPENPDYTPTQIPPERAQVLNMLMGMEQPQTETPGQNFARRFAEANGITVGSVGGVSETNSLRERLRGQGFDPRILNAVVENLRVDRITTPLKVRSDLNFPAGDTGIQRAGFMPDTEAFKRGDILYLRDGTEVEFLRHLPAVRGGPDDGLARAVVREVKGPPTDHRISVDGLFKLPPGVDPDKAPPRKPLEPHPNMKSLLSSMEREIARRRRELEEDFGPSFMPVADDIARYNEIQAEWKDLVAKGEGGSERIMELWQENETIKNRHGGMPPVSPRRARGNESTREVASAYIRENRIENEPHEKYATIDQDRMKRIADWYESAKHEPESPEVQAAYQALADETLAQYRAMEKAGIKIEPYTGKGEPYANSTEMMKDVRDNRHLWFFTTDQGFGSGEKNPNALLQKSGVTINGKDLVMNDLFRAVHDYFGHTAEGYEFGPRGEYNAYLAHSRMFSDAAKPALAAETLAQNAWVNFGPHLRRPDGTLPRPGDLGFKGQKERPFADQKNTLVPAEILAEVDESGRNASYMPEFKLGKKETEYGEEFRPVVGKAGAHVGRIEPDLANGGFRALTMGRDELGNAESYAAALKLFTPENTKAKVRKGPPARTTAPDKNVPSPTGWVLPDGSYQGQNDRTGVYQNTGDWHGNHLGDNMDAYANQFGLKRGKAEDLRLAALRSGFVRMRYDGANGRMGVEANIKHFKGKQLAKVQDVLEQNLGKIDRLDVNLFDDTGKVVRANGEAIFRLDDFAKSQAVLDILKGRPMQDVTARYMPDVPVQTERNKKQFSKSDSGQYWLDPHGNLHALNSDHETWAAAHFNAEKNGAGTYSDQLVADHWLKVKMNENTLSVTGREVSHDQQMALERLGDEFEKSVSLKDWEPAGRDRELFSPRFMPVKLRAAIVGPSGKVYTGRLHFQAFLAAAEAGEFKKIGVNDGEQLRKLSPDDEADMLNRLAEVTPEEGFVDPSGKFYDRDAAAELVGQKRELDSFDLSPEARFMPQGSDIRDTRTYKSITKHLAPAERDSIRSDTAKNLVDVFESLPKDEDFETAVRLGGSKKGWYQRAAVALRTIFGEDTETFVGVLAATSPRQSVQKNLVMSLEVWKAWNDAGRPSDPAEIRKITDSMVQLDSRRNNVVRALTGKDLVDTPVNTSDKIDNDTFLSGFKVESFRRNLLGDMFHSTNDSWMAQFAGIEQKIFGTKAGYLAFTAKVRRVADKVGVKPAEVQETVWSFFKTLVESTRVDRPAKDVLANLSEKDILTTPEFHDELIENPEVRELLGKLGFKEDQLLGLRDPEISRQREVASDRPLASIVLPEGKDHRRVLKRLGARAQEIKNRELAEARATNANVVPEALGESPF